MSSAARCPAAGGRKGEWPAAGDVLYLVAAAAASLALGAWVFNRADNRIAVEL